MWSLLVAVALAGSPEGSIEVGHLAPAAAGEVALGISGAWRFDDLFAVRAHAMYVAHAGRGGTRSVTKQQLAPHEPERPTRVAAWLGAEAVFSPVVATFGERRVFVDLGVGAAMVHTQDDLRLLQGTDDPNARSTARQWHPAPVLVWGAHGALCGRLGLGLRVRHTWVVDTVAGTQLAVMRPTALSIAVSLR